MRKIFGLVEQSYLFSYVVGFLLFLCYFIGDMDFGGVGILLLTLNWLLLPYLFLGHIAVEVHMNGKRYKTLVIASTLVMVPAIIVYTWAFRITHEEYLAIRSGAKNCGLPAFLIAMFWVALLPLYQLAMIGLFNLSFRNHRID
jgi:hypothetical protein